MLYLPIYAVGRDLIFSQAAIRKLAHVYLPENVEFVEFLKVPMMKNFVGINILRLVGQF